MLSQFDPPRARVAFSLQAQSDRPESGRSLVVARVLHGNQNLWLAGPKGESESVRAVVRRTYSIHKGLVSDRHSKLVRFDQSIDDTLGGSRSDILWNPRGVRGTLGFGDSTRFESRRGPWPRRANADRDLREFLGVERSRSTHTSSTTTRQTLGIRRVSMRVLTQCVGRGTMNRGSSLPPAAFEVTPLGA